MLEEKKFGLIIICNCFKLCFVCKLLYIELICCLNGKLSKMFERMLIIIIRLYFFGLVVGSRVCIVNGLVVGILFLLIVQVFGIDILCEWVLSIFFYVCMVVVILKVRILLFFFGVVKVRGLVL